MGISNNFKNILISEEVGYFKTNTFSFEKIIKMISENSNSNIKKCRARKQAEKMDLLAVIRVDTAKNGPPKASRNLVLNLRILSQR